MKLQLSLTDYTNDDVGKTVEMVVVSLAKVGPGVGKLRVACSDPPAVKVFDLDKIGDLRLSVHEE